MEPTRHPHLTATQLLEIEDLLKTEHARLSRRLAQKKRDGPVHLDQQAVGRLSRMDALMNEGLAQGSLSRAQEEVGLIELALERLADGTYGFCQSCKEPISPDRLLAIPETLRCAGCRV